MRRKISLREADFSAARDHTAMCAASLPSSSSAVFSILPSISRTVARGA